MTAILKIRYSQEIPANVSVLELWNNDGKIRDIEFSNTGSTDSDWQYLEVSVPIHSGANNITLVAVSDKVPNIDEILLE